MPQEKPTDLHRFHARLLAWYRTHGRHHLPWRTTDDPYHIWVSEVMLQQTQVQTVLDRFYFPFLEKFPTVEALANAPEEAVMKAWEGLGYYRRARHLHAAAKQVVSSEWWVVSRKATAPLTTHHSLLTSLPGIGKNTAHAILAFGFRQPVAILEANVKRIVARVFALENPSDKELWASAERLMGVEPSVVSRESSGKPTITTHDSRLTTPPDPFDYNQAMMDLGSMVCTPTAPRCGECPAASVCAGKGDPTRYPTPKAKKQTPTREVTILVREDANGRLFLEPREAALLGGLYGFPQEARGQRSEVREKGSHARRHAEFSSASIPTKNRTPEGCSATLATGDWRLATTTPLGVVRHTYSHFKLLGHVVHEKTQKKMNAPNWHTREEIGALPLSTVDHKVLALVDNCNTRPKKRMAK